MVNYKYCPACNGPNFVACKRCRQCSHVFITGGGNKRKSRAADGVGSTPAAGGSGSSAPFAQRRRLQQPSSTSYFASYAALAPSQPGVAASDDNADTCCVCNDTGRLLCCDVCPLAYHLDCVALEVIPKGQWACPRCVIDQQATAEKAAGDAAARERADGGKGGEAAEAGQGGAAAGGAEGGKPGKAAGAMLHGLDSEQQSLWSRLAHEQAEETEVDGLLFLCFPPPRTEEAKDEAKQPEATDDQSKHESALTEQHSVAAAAGELTSAETAQATAEPSSAGQQLESAALQSVPVS